MTHDDEAVLDTHPAASPDDPPALDVLGDLDQVPPAEHVARFEALHDALRARLDDAAPGPGSEA